MMSKYKTIFRMPVALPDNWNNPHYNCVKHDKDTKLSSLIDAATLKARVEYNSVFKDYLVKNPEKMHWRVVKDLQDACWEVLMTGEAAVVAMEEIFIREDFGHFRRAYNAAPDCEHEIDILDFISKYVDPWLDGEKKGSYKIPFRSLYIMCLCPIIINKERE